MGALWRCGVCETVNDGGRTCIACGADLTRRSVITTTVRTKLAPVTPPPPPPAPLPPVVRKAINRELVTDDEWAEYEESTSLIPIPIPGGCLVIGRRGSW